MYDVVPITSPLRTDCGATCMTMLLRYYGEDAQLEEIIRECNTRLIGCSAKDLIRVGKAHGLDMKAFQMDGEEVARQDRPSIVWWKYAHWCVCCGTDEEGNVVICNPDRGMYRMKQSTFNSFYTKVALFNGDPQDLPTA